MISDKHRLEGGDTEIIDRPVRLDAADDGGEESFGIWSAFDDGAGKRTTEEWRNFILVRPVALRWRSLPKNVHD